jgi:hypothetical protein
MTTDPDTVKAAAPPVMMVGELTGAVEMVAFDGGRTTELVAAGATVLETTAGEVTVVAMTVGAAVTVVYWIAGTVTTEVMVPAV